MYEAEGLAFLTKEEAETAKTEAESIRYLKEQMKMDDPDTILKLYNSLLEKRLFQTEVGLRFLFELQDYLATIPYLKSEDIQPIPAQKIVEPKGKKVKKEKPKKTPTPKPVVSADVKTLRLKSRFFLFTSIILLAAVVGMFVITYISGNTTNIVNYENQIINQYSSWEQELSEREASLRERESEIEEREEELGIRGQ